MFELTHDCNGGGSPQLGVGALHREHSWIGHGDGGQRERAAEDVDRRSATVTRKDGLLLVQPGDDEGLSRCPSPTPQSGGGKQGRRDRVSDYRGGDGWTDLHRIWDQDT